MPDLTLSLLVSRTLLALPALELNDHLNYTAAPYSPAVVSWQAERVSSRYVDDDFTVSRRRGKVTEELVFEVLPGATGTDASLDTNLAALLAALAQDSFTLTTTINGVARVWACEAADYQVAWSGPRVVAKQLQVRASIPRSPSPVSGSF